MSNSTGRQDPLVEVDHVHRVGQRLARELLMILCTRFYGTADLLFFVFNMPVSSHRDKVMRKKKTLTINHSISVLPGACWHNRSDDPLNCNILTYPSVGSHCTFYLKDPSPATQFSQTPKHLNNPSSQKTTCLNPI